MRTTMLGIVAASLLIASSCTSSDDDTESASEPVAVEFLALGMYPDRMEGFTATGAAVDDGVVCEAGDLLWHGNKQPDGAEFTDVQFAEQISSGEVFEFAVMVEYECSDASGSFTMAMDVVFDPATNTQTKTWRIESGTGDYSNLTGSGDSEQVQTPQNQTTHTGTVQTG